MELQFPARTEAGAAGSSRSRSSISAQKSGADAPVLGPVFRSKKYAITGAWDWALGCHKGGSGREWAFCPWNAIAMAQRLATIYYIKY